MEEEFRRVLSYYDLGELKGVWRVECGFVNENWILETTHGRYFLKRRHPHLRNAEVICAQHTLIAHLRRCGFPAPAVLPASDGDTLLVLDGEFYEIQEYIEGVRYEHISQARFQAAAAMLAHYHNCIRGFGPRALHDLGDLYCPAILNVNLTSLTEVWELDQDPTLAWIVRRLESHAADLMARFARHAELPQLVIHGDYHAGNLLFEEDRIVGLVDYDKARWQPRVVELAEVLIYFASPWPGHLKHLVYSGFLEWDKFMRFLRHYACAEETCLKANELCALPNYIRCIWLSVSLERMLEKGSRPAEAPEALRELLALVDWSAANTRRMIGTSCKAIGATSDRETP
jgi:homoserine kinase type II